jgi:hypothetical protein
MANDLGGAIIDLLGSDRVELRAAAATVLAAVGRGDRAVETALTSRLADPDVVVRRIALDGLADMGARGIAAALVPLLRDDDATVVERARALIALEGARAEPALRDALAAGPIAARRAIAQLLLARATPAALDAVLDQLGDPELGEPALQLVRAELDREAGRAAAGAPLADLIEQAAVARVRDAGKRLAKAWAASQAGAVAGKRAKPGKPGKPTRAGAAAPRDRAASPVDPLRDPELAHGVAVVGNLLRLIGYLARPATQALLLGHVDADQPRPIRLAAIAALRRIVSHDVKGGDKLIAALIELAAGDDVAVAQAAVDTLRGARIPEALARPFAALARSQHAAAQKLAMERMPAGGGATAVKALIEALGGDDPAARDAAGRGLAKAPEAVLPVTRALLATTDEQVARRYAGVLRSHRGQVTPHAIDELVDRVRDQLDRHAKGKATADEIVVERVLAELIADLAPARHVELLFERARRLRKAGRSVEAFATLKPLLRSRPDIDAAIDDEQRFVLAVLALEAAGDGLLRAARADDPALAQVARLAAGGFPVARRLAREGDVSDEAIYALGFRLLESGDGGREDLGAELLLGIIDERPRSKLAKAARNKLKLTGHLDD